MDAYRTIVALGSNLGNREQTIFAALNSIKKLMGEVLRVSNFYMTHPVGNNADKNFINGAALIESFFEPHDQLDILLAIEKNLGRQRHVHWGNRTIDLDIIGIEQSGKSIKINTQSLVCPHPRAESRDFVLVPAAEVAPNHIHPDFNTTLSNLVKTKNFHLNRAIDFTYKVK